MIPEYTPMAATLVRAPFHRAGDIAAAIARFSARTLVLDGELAIYDQQLRSRFDWMREPDPDAVASPPLFMAFDLLYHERRDLTGRPLRDRRARLEDVVHRDHRVVIGHIWPLPHRRRP